MSRNNIDGAWARAFKLLQSISGGVNKITSGATVNLASDVPLLNFITLTGSGQNVVMPLPSTLLEGRMIFVFNTSASALSATIKQNDGTTTVVAVAQGKAALLVCDGTTWYGMLGA